MTFFQHEKLVKDHINKFAVNRFRIGDKEFTFTDDSFKLNEIDYDKLVKPCEVCILGDRCPFRVEIGRFK
jgi:hypothetical protein